MAPGLPSQDNVKNEDWTKTDVFGDAPISFSVHAPEELLQRSLLPHELWEWEFSIVVSVHLQEKWGDLLPVTLCYCSIVSRLKLHWCLTSGSWEDLQPLLLRELTVTSLVHLREHLLDLNKTNKITPGVRSAQPEQTFLRYLVSLFIKERLMIISFNGPVPLSW